MISTILTLIHKEITGFRKDRMAVVLTFLVPLVLIYIFGNVFGVRKSGSPGPSGIPLAIVSQTESPAVEAVIKSLEADSGFNVRRTWKDASGAEHPLAEEQVRAEITGTDSQYRFALVFPDDALSKDHLGLRVRLLYNPRNEIETQMAMGLLQKGIFTAAPSFLFASLRERTDDLLGKERTDRFYDSLADTIADNFKVDREELRSAMKGGGNPLAVGSANGDGKSGDAGDFLSKVVDIQKEQLVGKQVKSPEATRLVGGWAIMFLLFSVTGSSTSLLDEKKAGLFYRLLSMPVTRAQILWSKWAFNVLMGLAQLTVLFFAGKLMFGIDIFTNLPALLIVCVCTAGACTAFGMLLAAVSKTTATASGLGTLLILTMSAVGGAWFPVGAMPAFMQFFSKLTLVYWAQEGFLGVLWADQSLLSMLPVLGVLVGMAVVLNIISLALFRRGSMFS